VISTSIILILGLVSYLFGRKIARPLAILEKATKQIGKGDFKYRIDLWQKDEFGSLADSFNNMAARLQQTTTSIELFENELAERKLAEEQLLEKEETLKVITESTNDAIIIMNNRGIITFWNTAASNMLRYSKEEALGENLHESIVPERFLNAHLSAFPQFIKTGKGNAIGTTLELYAIGKDHIEIPVELSLSSIMIEGEWFAVGIMRDNTERKKMEEELRRLATIDSLTNINNRRYFLDLALKEMDRSKRYGHPFSLIMLDIDHFKKVNDTYGHSVGDQVLIDFCDTCMKEFRESDFMGRLGGEEFAVAIVECDLEGAAILAERIREAVASHTVVIGNEEIRFTVSIGITRMWQDCDLNSMIESADNALYKAKNNGRNQVQFAEIKPV
jgi:diguanylate cyclase (GGDEF)-like protein/PAS domain S-box-containing protein